LHVTTHNIGGNEYAISGLAEIGQAEVGANGELRFQVRPRTGNFTHLVIVMPRTPSSVTVDGEEVGSWRWDEGSRLLFLTIEHMHSSVSSVVVD